MLQNILQQKLLGKSTIKYYNTIKLYYDTRGKYYNFSLEYTEATKGFLEKKIFLKISQNSQETPVPETLF